jgi:ribosomal subunit interface protein
MRTNPLASGALSIGSLGGNLMNDVAVDKQVTVGSSNVDLGEALIQSARQGVLDIAQKYFQRITVGSVHFAHEGINYRCSVNIQPGGLKMASAEGQNKDIRLALNAALERVGKQLRRMKREMHEH